MNKDQATGKMKGMAGKAQEKLGQASGSTRQQLKGMGKQLAGKAQEAMGDLKNAAKKSNQDR
jgi:uncharacterized protein YjbJ (UPF0337 family)